MDTIRLLSLYSSPPLLPPGLLLLVILLLLPFSDRGLLFTLSHSEDAFVEFMIEFSMLRLLLLLSSSLFSNKIVK